MGQLAQVRDVFGNLRRSIDRLDFLVLSAGINTNQFGLDADGIDRHFGVNVLGQFYVCNQLWPVMVKTASDQYNPPPRVVFEASEMHRTAPSKVHFASLEEINNKDLGPTELYGRTKLALILLAKYGLAEKVIKPNGQRIYANSVHPGAVSYQLSLPIGPNTDAPHHRSTRQCSSSGRTPTPASRGSSSPGPCSRLAETPSRERSVLCGP